MEQLEEKQDALCAVTHCSRLVGGKWKLIILFRISGKLNRFGALHRAIPGITKQMLTQQLRELEADGILNRKVFAEIPPRVEYSLTKRGRSIMPLVKAMKAWGEEDLRKAEEAKRRNQLDLPL